MLHADILTAHLRKADGLHEMHDSTPLPMLDPGGLSLSPTDVSQFIRLEQCERYLRLRLHERCSGRQFLKQYGVAPQAIPPLLTRAGREFEESVEARIRERFHVIDLARPAVGDSRAEDNARVVAAAQELSPGEALVLFQPRLRVELAGWLLTGDPDILRLTRDEDGRLEILIADVKSAARVKVEHRLQLAFYHAMVARLLEEAALLPHRLMTAILYPSPLHGEASGDEDECRRRAKEREAARHYFALPDERLELNEAPDAYLDSVADLVTGPDAAARRVCRSLFEEVPYHLSYKCDGCLYNEFCMKWSAERDDLSLIPHLSATEKKALRRLGVTTARDLVGLKELTASPESAGKSTALAPAAGMETLCRKVATTWPVGHRIDELIHRARRYRKWRGDPLEALSEIPSKGYGSLPYCDATHNPNLVRVYIDAQHDYLCDRVYLLGARVVGCDAGRPARWQNVVHLSDAPPESAESERRLLAAWTRDLLAAIVTCTSPDDDGGARAPIHLIFFDRFEQKVLLEALSRHLGAVLGAAPALYDFMTQLAAFDSPIATFLDEEIRELKNYPMLCQSLQAVAGYLGFPWDATEPFTRIFRTHLFDQWRKQDDERPTTTSSDQRRETVNRRWSELVVVGRSPFAEHPAPSTQHSWYTGRARFGSQIPLEYAYAAWGELEPTRDGEPDSYASYRQATAARLRAFQARRLEALEHVAGDFRGNPLTEKRAFDLPDLSAFTDTARSLAQALDEFVVIERHVELHHWKMLRHAPPERRVLMGETLLVRYVEEDQAPGIALALREGERRLRLRAAYKAAFRQQNPEVSKIQLSKEEREETKWSPDGLRVRLRLEANGLDADLDEVLPLFTLQQGDRFVLTPRWTVDERLPEDERARFTPTPKQMLYGLRASFVRLQVDRDATGRNIGGSVEVELREARGGSWSRGFIFSTFPSRALLPGEVYALDPCPNDPYGYFCAVVSQALRAAEDSGSVRNALYERLRDPDRGGNEGVNRCRGERVREPVSCKASLPFTPAPVHPFIPSPQEPSRPREAAEGQARFLDGLAALCEAGALHDFEPSKREYIGGHGDAPILLVQGPPGTGKSYATAFALLARLQGALAAGRSFRAILACKTHAATDVLLDNLVRVRERLRETREQHPDLFAAHFDARLLAAPLYRLAGRRPPPDGVIPLVDDRQREKGQPRNADRLLAESCCLVAATPGAIYQMVKAKWDKDLLGHSCCDCLVLDEASQMNLPEAMMAALPLSPDGQLIVVGDHRQMPPIIKHDWAGEPRRTFQEYRAYESLFEALRGLTNGGRLPALRATLPPLAPSWKRPPMIRFEESFRLHAETAAFLGREIYAQDGIDFHSRRRDLLPPLPHADPFLAAVLASTHPLVVVLHDEVESQTRNPFEQALLVPILDALTDPTRYGLDADQGLGVVVPHRAQRAALQSAFPALCALDDETGTLLRSAVDTVERFQGDERTVILVSATESDRDYLLAASRFLLDPRRLTVAMSRAKQKLILVASRSIFALFSPEEEAFANAQLWKNLLRRTCTVKLWEGEREKRWVEVWGNAPADP